MDDRLGAWGYGRGMRHERTVLAGLNVEIPPLEVTSAALEDRLAPLYQRLGLHAGRLELMTGIEARRFWPDDPAPSEIAGRAAEKALEDSGIARAKIGAVIHASVCRDFLEPATANVVHDGLSLPASSMVFDVSNACLGVLNGVLLLADMIELGRIEAGLVVAGENGRPLVESTIAKLLADESVTRKSLKADFASLTIGAGASAIVVANKDLAPGGHKLTGAVVRSATQYNTLCRGGGGEGRADAGVGGGSQIDMATDAEALLHAGIELATQAWSEAKPELGFSERAPDRVITHQVGKAHHHALLGALGLEDDTSFVTYPKFGNIGSVSWPLTLHQAAAEGFVRTGHDVAVLGIGSGLSTIMAGIQW